MVEFGEDVQITYVMGGLARELEPPHDRRLAAWLEQAGRSGMPFDPRLWSEGPIRSTYPACMAVKAASEQGGAAGARYLRALREGLMCFRRKLDTPEPLVELAREAGLDVARFRIDLDSNAIVEAFGADLEATRAGPHELPSFELSGPSGLASLTGAVEPAALREAALRAGARPSDAPAPGRARSAAALRANGSGGGGGGLRPPGPTSERRAMAPGGGMASEADPRTDRRALRVGGRGLTPYHATTQGV